MNLSPLSKLKNSRFRRRLSLDAAESTENLLVAERSLQSSSTWQFLAAIMPCVSSHLVVVLNEINVEL